MEINIYGLTDFDASVLSQCTICWKGSRISISAANSNIGGSTDFAQLCFSWVGINHEMFLTQSSHDSRRDTPPLNPKFDQITLTKFSRPSLLESLSHKQYTPKWKVPRRKTLNVGSENEYKDLSGKIVVKRIHSLGNDVILDLKIRGSPPSPEYVQWCAGALALHVPHRSAFDLLRNYGTFTKAYKYFTQLRHADGTYTYRFLSNLRMTR